MAASFSVSRCLSVSHPDHHVPSSRESVHASSCVLAVGSGATLPPPRGARIRDAVGRSARLLVLFRVLFSDTRVLVNTACHVFQLLKCLFFLLQLRLELCHNR